jgi:hypothetical protein
MFPADGTGSWRQLPQRPDSGPRCVYACAVPSPPAKESSLRRRTWLAMGIVVAAAIWVLVNGPVEGPVLLVMSPSHGITVADLPSIGAVIIAGLILWS